MVSYSDFLKGKGEVYLVLILIVMDNGLLHLHEHTNKRCVRGLNPYCNG